MSHVHCNYECPICGLTEKEIKFYGFGQCNHPICAVCAIKLQKFSKDSGTDYDYSKCVICKQEITKIIIANQINTFETYNDQQLLSGDNIFGLFFDSAEAKSFYHNIIKISCPKCNELHYSNIEELISHLDLVHKHRYCELCMEFKKCLQSELEVYNGNDYFYHRDKMHPKCRFCEIRFYDDSHLIKHVKSNHFVCDICHRNRGFVAYSTQAELMKHFLKDHHVCEICRSSNSINVFDSEYSLKTHKVSSHERSLVDEGLVNINFGDRDIRFSNRRRARQNDFEDIINEAPQSVPQVIPTMDCEQEFPPLGPGFVEQTSCQQLGAPCFTVDENDSRTAFTSIPNNMCDNDKKQAVSTATTRQGSVTSNGNNKVHQTMSNNFAISVKKSSGGKLNPDDFPLLSSQSQKETINLRSVDNNNNKQKLETSQSTKPITKNKQNDKVLSKNVQESEEFPALPQTSRGQTSSKAYPKNATASSRSWKDTIKENQNATKSDVKSQFCQFDNTIKIEEEKVDSVNSFVTSKVSLVDNDKFLQSSNKSSTKPVFQKIPDEHDFPTLGLSSNKKQSMMNTCVTSKIGTWGQFSVVPTSVLSGDNGKMKSLPNKKKATKKGVITEALSNLSIATRQQPQKTESDTVYSTVSSAKTPASLRGIDYIPSDAPAKDVVKLVDSTQFSKMKAARGDIIQQDIGSKFSISSMNEEKIVTEDDDINDSSNRFNALQHGLKMGVDDFSLKTAVANGNKSGMNIKKVPTLSSDLDFPSLGLGTGKERIEKGKGSRKQRQSSPSLMTNQQQTTNRNRGKEQKKKSNDSSQQSQLNDSRLENVVKPSPVFSLMDVAMTISKKEYTQFTDSQERNEELYNLLFQLLEPEFANRFLSLSNLYRTRKLSVKEYLDVIQSELGSDENLKSIPVILPKMCVLLPDIPLQRSLFNNMPKSWVRDLRECLKCDQVLHKSDVDVHNELAH